MPMLNTLSLMRPNYESILLKFLSFSGAQKIPGATEQRQESSTMSLCSTFSNPSGVMKTRDGCRLREGRSWAKAKLQDCRMLHSSCSSNRFSSFSRAVISSCSVTCGYSYTAITLCEVEHSPWKVWALTLTTARTWSEGVLASTYSLVRSFSKAPSEAYVYSLRRKVSWDWVFCRTTPKWSRRSSRQSAIMSVGCCGVAEDAPI